jgi:hypothetical protein
MGIPPCHIDSENVDKVSRKAVSLSAASNWHLAIGPAKAGNVFSILLNQPKLYGGNLAANQRE